MAVVFAQDIIEVVMKHSYNGRPIYNVLHVFNDETGGDDESKARDVLNNWQDHIIGASDASMTLLGASWASLDPDDTNQGELVPDAGKPTIGGAGGTGLPPNCAYLIKKITSGRQRGQRDGRMFIGGCTEANVDEAGVILPAFRTAFQGSLNSFLSGVNDSGVTLGEGSYLAVLNTTPESRVKGGPPVTLTHRKVDQLVFDNLLATQRDRMR